MKIVLKRRKHRNGVRPKRKGSLKVNLQELPTWEGLAQGEKNLLNEYNAILHAEGNQAYRCRMTLLEQVLLMQRAFRFLYSYEQAESAGLALAAINESSPKYFKQKAFDRSSICLFVCLHNCPFADKNLSEEKLTRRCPILRHAFQDYALDKRLENQYTLPVNQSEIANLALTHLS